MNKEVQPSGYPLCPICRDPVRSGGVEVITGHNDPVLPDKFLNCFTSEPATVDIAHKACLDDILGEPA